MTLIKIIGPTLIDYQTILNVRNCYLNSENYDAYVNRIKIVGPTITDYQTSLHVRNWYLNSATCVT